MICVWYILRSIRFYTRYESLSFSLCTTSICNLRGEKDLRKKKMELRVTDLWWKNQFIAHLPISMTPRRLEGLPKIRMVGPAASKSETKSRYANSSISFSPSTRKHHQLPRELQAVAEFANDPDARSHIHHHNMRLPFAISRAHALQSPAEVRREAHRFSEPHRCRHHRFFLPFRDAGRSTRTASLLAVRDTTSARLPNDETLCSVQRSSLFLNLLKGKQAA